LSIPVERGTTSRDFRHRTSLAIVQCVRPLPEALTLITALITPILPATLSRIAALLALGLRLGFLRGRQHHNSRYCKARRSGFQHQRECASTRDYFRLDFFTSASLSCINMILSGGLIEDALVDRPASV